MITYSELPLNNFHLTAGLSPLYSNTFKGAFYRGKLSGLPKICTLLIYAIIIASPNNFFLKKCSKKIPITLFASSLLCNIPVLFQKFKEHCVVVYYQRENEIYTNFSFFNSRNLILRMHAYPIYNDLNE